MAGANVLPIIDTSFSMTSSGYVQTTQTDSEAFVRSARPGDRIGVVSYDQMGRVTYPSGGNQLVTVDFSLKQTREAAAAIQQLQFVGGCTNIGGGIQTARQLMDLAPAPKGLVLLSDGYQNCGTSPLQVLPTYPIYSCAMGPYSDQSLMRQIAVSTGGTYYYAPTPFDMMLIFNEIRGELDLAARIVTNELSSLTAGQSASYDIPIADAQSAASFPYVWNDVNLKYTPDPPTGQQIRVRLVDPSGVVLTDGPQVIGDGYVIWNIQSPAAGTWKIEVELGATIAAEPVPVTAAGFEYGEESAVRLNIGDRKALQQSYSAASQVRLIENGHPLAADVKVEKLVADPKLVALLGGTDGIDSEPKGAPIDRDLGSGSSTTYRIVARGTSGSGRTVQRTSIVTLVAGA